MTATIEENRDLNTAPIALIVAAQGGDREAFGELVVRYEAAVLATALRRLGNYAEAEELTQEVFVQAMQRIGQLREPERFGGWLRTITVRMAINRMTRTRNGIATEPETLAATCVDTETPLTNVLAAEQAARVRAGLRRLRKLDRETLVAFYMKGQTLIEMADAFDAPIGTIKRRLHVARKRLATELAEEDSEELVAM